MSKGRRREDFKGGDPDVGKATQIKPGQCLNPTGKNGRTPMTTRYANLLEEPLTPALLVQLGIAPRSKFGRILLGKGLTVGDAIARNMAGIAITGQKFAAVSAHEMTDRVEGKAIQRIGGPDGEALIPPKLTVNFVKRPKK